MRDFYKILLWFLYNKKCKNPTQCQFSMSNNVWIFLIFLFVEEYWFRRLIFGFDIFLITQNFRSLYFLNMGQNFQFVRYVCIKKIFHRSILGSKNLSCVTCATWNVFPLNLLSDCKRDIDRLKQVSLVK